MAITFSSNIITVDATHTSGSPVTFQDIYDEDVANSWGAVTKEGELYRFTARLRLNGWLKDYGVAVEFSGNLNYIEVNGSSAGLELGRYDATFDYVYDTCKLLYTNKGSSTSTNTPSFIGTCDVTLNGLILIASGSGRIDFSGTDNNAVVRRRYCKIHAKDGVLLPVQNFVAVASQVDLGCEYTSSNSGSLQFNVTGGADYTGLAVGDNIITRTGATGQTILREVKFLFSPPRCSPKNGRQQYIDPILPTGFEVINIDTTVSNGGLSANTLTEIYYTYRPTVTDELNNDLEDARLVVLDGSNTSVVDIVSDSNGEYADQTILKQEQSGTSTTWTDQGPHKFYHAHYGNLPLDARQLTLTSASLQGAPLVDPIKLTSYSFVSATASAAAAISGVAITHSPDTITLSQSRTVQEVHDYSHYYKTTSTGIIQDLPLLNTQSTDSETSYKIVINSGVTLTSSGITLRLSGGISFADAGDKSALTAIVPASEAVEVVGGTTDLSSFTFSAGSTIDNTSASAATITVASDPGIVTTSSGGGSVTIQTPQASFTAPNASDGVRYQLAHRQTFTIAAADINTGTDAVTLGNDSNGDAASFSTSAPETLVRFVLATGATIPTTSPQIVDGGVYRVKTESSGVITLSVISGGATIDFTDTGTDSGGTLATLVAETELANAAVSGGSGISEVLSLNNNASVRFKAIHWSESGGIASASTFKDRVLTWNSTTGSSLADTIDSTNTASANTLHNRITALTGIVLPDGSEVTPSTDGSAVTGLTVALEGVGKVQINISDPDGQLLVQDIFLWGTYISSTEAGIRLVSENTFVAQNLFNFVIKNLEFENTNSSVPLSVVGGLVIDDDGLTPIATTSNPIFFNVGSAGVGAVVETGVSGLTASESTALTNIDTRTSRVDGLIEDSSGDRFTTKALEQAPSGGSAPSESDIYSYFTASNRQDTFKATGFSTHSAADVRSEIDSNSTQLAAILADTGTDIPASISGLNDLSQADVRTALGMASANLDTQLGDVPTVSELNARTLPSADYFDPTTDTVANVTTVSSIGVTFPANFSSLAIDGSGQVTAENMRGTDGAITDISTITSNIGLILGHTRPMAKQLGLVSGVTATHTPTAITVSDGDGSTTITDNGSDSYTVQST